MKERENWLNVGVMELAPLFEAYGYPLPDKIRVSCGFPSVKARSINKAIGEHHAPANSKDGTHEIFVSPVIDDPYQVFGVLIHELCHSATVGDGHKGRFPKVIRKFHLEGKPTATTVGDTFKSNFQALVESLGQYPHAELSVFTRKTQSTRMLGAVCPSCGYKVRLAKKWADIGLPVCVCGSTFNLS